jgi:hypothetical protein
MPNVNIILNTGHGPGIGVERRQSTRITQAQTMLKRRKKYIADTIRKLLGKLLPLRNELSRLNDEVDLRYNRHNEDRERLDSLRQRIYQESTRSLIEQQRGNSGQEQLTAYRRYNEHRLNVPTDIAEITGLYQAQSDLHSDMVAASERSVQDLIRQRAAAEEQERRSYDAYHHTVQERDDVTVDIPELEHRLGVLERMKTNLNRTGQTGRGRKIKINVSRKNAKRQKGKSKRA